MAEQRQTRDVDANALRETECPVCTEQYSEQRTPKLLSCHHTLCITCIESLLANGILRCPMCRREHTILGGRADSLRTNSYVLTMLEIINQHRLLSEDVNAKGDKYAKLISLTSDLRRQMQQQSQRLRELETAETATTQQMQLEIDHWKQQSKTRTDELEACRKREKECVQQCNSTRQRAQQLEERCRTNQDQLATCRTQLQDGQRKEAQLIRQLQEQSDELCDLRLAVGNLQAESDRLRQRERELTAQRAALQATNNRLGDDLRVTQGSNTDLNRRVQQLQNTLKDEVTRKEAAETEVDKVQRQLQMRNGEFDNVHRDLVEKRQELQTVQTVLALLTVCLVIGGARLIISSKQVNDDLHSTRITLRNTIAENQQMRDEGDRLKQDFQASNERLIEIQRLYEQLAEKKEASERICKQEKEDILTEQKSECKNLVVGAFYSGVSTTICVVICTAILIYALGCCIKV